MAGVSYCVRLCDGRYFPIQRSAKATPIELCNAFCPAAATKVFSGSPIEQATARDGSRYDDLDNAYAYRKTVVPDCSCNGREPFGTALMDLASDPTLRAGDLISTVNGLIAYAPNKSDPDAMADVTGSLGLRGKFGSDDAKRSRGATYRLLP